MGLKEFLLGNRWVLAVWLLPISFIYDLIWYVRSKYVFWAGSAPKKHDERVKYVQKQVRDWQTLGKGRKMCTARPQWMSISQQKINYKSTSYQVEVNLMDILNIDTDKMVVTCEPMVSIGRLIDLLIPLGYTVPIVPEIGDLTVGGLVMGGGIESTSHKYGLWQHICPRYEIVVADGTLMECSKDKNSDLYYVIPWSYGTFGFLTALDIQIIPYKSYIRLEYQPTYTMEESMKVFDHETRKESGNDSVEGIMYSRDKGVIMTGVFTDECEKDKYNPIGRWYKPWFFTEVVKVLDEGKKVEYIPTKDFYFRHNKPFFWLTDVWVPFGNHPIFRYLFGYLLPYNYGLLKLINERVMPTQLTENFVVQDFGIPAKYFKTAIDFFDDIVGIYPLWLCPARALDTGPIHSLKDEDEIHIDIGIYGHCKKPKYDKVETLRAMEKFARDYNGYQGLYAETLMTYEEFKEMFDGTTYFKVRNSLPLTEEAFPEVYHKVSKMGRT
ncbi:hypothetical protein TCAL_01985 [Tigriopus californicus]|uniref:Delta(24)-sterol reductase n=1 Tax=Tigriopus californicus TaxID=6832 RepID=A0A553PPV9_TIGCA|nr:delta(24)-sterol reductase-like [Tigriopus californicus]XP_059085168.1 delta(24)-sterol reductase-like [Tigriopus californicus]XP_059085169.1 delta(24)-sterol reductase-like [Tigriopus californicus]TRY79718.1 hypothetical protein TCAL_01985 [Tigriopus californicus]|eukprot:TCALIF_01985-PA protein Name:"Similar to DHCR24 Delta(24)-sterol reductase (Macaca fascicularis)" AED:0.03 eAED:0.03 QI:456/1/1/1/0.66/0.71/7/159/495